jgi:hypothetical protein
MRTARSLREGDVEMLAGVVAYVGVEPGLKERLLVSLQGSRDRDRVDRLEPVLRRLDDSEILWLSENAERFRPRGRQRP